MWTVAGASKDASIFGRFEPKDVLIWHDGPRTFTLDDQDGKLCLAHWLDEDETAWRFVVAPITAKQLEQLSRGEMTLRESLDQPRVYLVDQGPNGDVREVWLTTLAELPQDALPNPGTMIRRELEPFFSLRAIGSAIQPGEIPGSVIKATVEGAQKAIKCLAEYEMDVFKRRGQPSRALKELYDLPAQKLLAASFEVQFRSPLTEPNLFDGLTIDDIKDEKDVLARVGEHLKKGLQWLERISGNEPSELTIDADPILNRVIVEAMKHLTPPTRGAIETMEVRGEAMRLSKPIRLTRDHRRRVINFQKTGGQDRPRKFEHTATVIDILGDDAMIRVELEKQGTSSIQRDCQLSEDLWEAYGESLRFNQSIQVYGIETSSAKPVHVIEISLIN